jgi:hypothetical protein
VIANDLHLENDNFEKLAKLRKQLDPLTVPKNEWKQLEKNQDELLARLKALRGQLASQQRPRTGRDVPGK